MSKKITILHPDLGIGGAERLIVDVAVALKKRGHSVTVVTNQFDPAHSFKECEELEIISVLSWLPRSTFGRFMAFWAYFKMCLAALYCVLNLDQQIVFVDQISAANIIFRMFAPRVYIVFYCHFPDQLLTDRKSTAKAVYRYPIDLLERVSTGLAHKIYVNSRFTASVVERVFPSLTGQLSVLYPSLNTKFFEQTRGTKPGAIGDWEEGSYDYLFVSLNRYEKKKNIDLALHAFEELSRLLSPSMFARCRLVIAGGYDRLNEENARVHDALKRRAQEVAAIEHSTAFLLSPSDEEKIWLLRNATAVLYTPANEHFGIVPVETMFCGTPVIAVCSGGPKESVDDGKTGFLVEGEPEQFAEAMRRLVTDENLRKEMQKEGPLHVQRLFSFEAFEEQLDQLVRSTL